LPGDGTTTDHLLPAPVVAVDGDTDLTEVASLASGHLHSCALLGSGDVRCWGWNLAGELGCVVTTDALARCAGASHGSAGSDSTTIPVPVAGIGGVGTRGQVAALSGTYNHVCAQLWNGEARCWGHNFGGVLGDGTTIDRVFPVAVGDPS
jgi:hypothetical protein